jgi:hypothetical protein
VPRAGASSGSSSSTSAPSQSQTTSDRGPSSSWSRAGGALLPDEHAVLDAVPLGQLLAALAGAGGDKGDVFRAVIAHPRILECVRHVLYPT